MAELSMKALLKKRSSTKGQMTRLVTFARSAEEKPLEHLKTRLQRAHSLLEEFTATEDQIYSVDDKEESEMAEFEENYYYVVSELNSAIRQMNLATANTSQSINESVGVSMNQHVSSEVKLPRITIPVFEGDYKDWQSFYDLFTKLIHENNTLSAAQKFQYLKGCLKGEASNLLKHMAISEANYIEAFQKLCKRYDKKKHIVNSFIQTFVEHPHIRNPSASALRGLTDTCDEVIRGLKALGTQFESRDPWLIYLVVNKLDEENQQRWANFIIDIVCPKWNDLFNFLNQRADAAEGFKASIKPTSYRKPTANIKSMHTTSDNKCSVCKAEPHHLSECSMFLNMKVADRRKHLKNIYCCYNCLNTNHPVFKCQAKGKCDKCSKRHHPLLHLEEEALQGVSANNLSNKNKSVKPVVITTNQITTCNIKAKVDNSVVPAILPTASVMLMSSSGELHPCRALLDSGSEMSLITESCVQRLNLSRNKARVTVSGLSSKAALISKGTTQITVVSRFNHQNILNFKVLILPKLTSKVPSLGFRELNLSNLKNLELADPDYNKPGEIDLLIGADQFFKILSSSRITNGSNNPIAQDTMFGWIIAGEFNETKVDHTVVNLFTEIDIDQSLRRFWELEEVPTKSIYTEEETLCEQHFSDNVFHQPDGRYVVSLPFKQSDGELGNSQASAIARLKSIERRFQRDPKFKEAYVTFMREYEILHHMELIPKNEIEVSVNNCFYLPHHGVMKTSSSTTKLRVVFDASASSQSGLSLNDKLMVGPTIQSSLLSILLRFRTHPVVFSADIEKMYRQVLINKKDSDYQRIVWRENSQMEPNHYRLLTVTYGTSCAPFLATRVLKQIASDVQDKSKIISRVIEEDFYIDDLMSGAETETEALNIQREIIKVFSKSGLNLRKWTSNRPALLETVSTEQRRIENVLFSEDSTVKVLGIEWNPTTDNFSFQINLDNTSSTTKRGILSESSRIFDPLGWLSPCTVLIKIFFQQLWLHKIDWDEQLSPSIVNKWSTLRNEIPLLKNITIPRWLGTTNVIELHGFADASELAYAAVVYSRVVQEDGNIIIRLISAKTKVAPIKQISIPRLELCAAGLLSKLIENTIIEMKLVNVPVYGWTDSTVVLNWLMQVPRQWKTFVANRVSQIHSVSTKIKWLHVRSKDNPADCASRGIKPSDLIHNSLWWNGPSWLLEDITSWPIKPIDVIQLDHNEKECILEERKNDSILVFSGFVSKHVSNIYETIISRRSSFSKIVSIIAWLNRYIHNCRTPKEKRRSGSLTVLEHEESANKLIRWVQELEFPEDIQQLQSNHKLFSSSRIRSLNPFVDDNNIIRVGGRIENSIAPFDIKHPIILPSSHLLIKRLVAEEHIKNLHSGITLLMNILKQKYWIIRGKNIVRKIVHDCIPCVRHQHKSEQQMMSDLPSARVTYERPFLKIGIDYAGPITIRMQRGRGRQVHKAYIALFVCCATKAVHIELVNDLTTESFFGAFHRFIARRGVCTDIFSDNGSNFIGANKQLTELFEFLKNNNNNISEFLLREKIQWHFNPSAAPHMGGLWEAAVKSTKYHLKRIVGSNILTYEEMSTLLARIEAILNSRPIVPLAADDIDVLTPAHFLIGHQHTHLPEHDLHHLKENQLSRWQLVQQISQHFWKRWHQEYLTAIQRRNKWHVKQKNIKENDMVIIKDDNLPSTKWSLGRIVNTHAGKDGLVRVVSIKTKSGIIKRPIQKLCQLPLFETDVSTRPEC